MQIQYFILNIHLFIGWFIIPPHLDLHYYMGETLERQGH